MGLKGGGTVASGAAATTSGSVAVGGMAVSVGGGAVGVGGTAVNVGCAAIAVGSDWVAEGWGCVAVAFWAAIGGDDVGVLSVPRVKTPDAMMAMITIALTAITPAIATQGIRGFAGESVARVAAGGGAVLGCMTVASADSSGLVSDHIGVR